jgi:hypothetical protein
MKIPLLSKRVQHKRFNYEPRYYDPVKEDIANRTARISAELGFERAANRRENIKAAFRSFEKHEKSIGLMQVLLMALLLGGFVGWIYYGNVALYWFAGLFILYIFLQARKKHR